MGSRRCSLFPGLFFSHKSPNFLPPFVHPSILLSHPSTIFALLLFIKNPWPHDCLYIFLFSSFLALILISIILTLCDGSFLFIVTGAYVNPRYVMFLVFLN